METEENKGKVALITGVVGQDGSYLAEFLLGKGYTVHGIIRWDSIFTTQRVEHLFQDPHTKDARFILHYGDMTDTGNLERLINKLKPDEIYHLAAMSHVRVSFDMPEYTVNTDALGTLRILEAVKNTGRPIKFYMAASSEQFGTTPPPQSEETPFHPRSPYAAAKVFSYNITRIYREAYKIFGCNGILFNHECITEQSPVIIRKNNLIDIVPIEEIVPHRENPQKGTKYTTLSNGDLEVWDGGNWTEIKTLTATWNKSDSRNDKKVKRIICRGGYYEATGDHISFLEGEKKIKTAQLKKGKKLELKSFPDLTNKLTLTLEEAEFLGMMVADGYISETGRGRFINNNRRLRKKIALFWEKIAGGQSRETLHPSGFGPKQVYSQELIGNNNYLRFIYQDVYTDKKYKRIPMKVINASPEIIRAFLRGYNQCDGLKAGRQKTEFKSFTTNSQTLAAGLWFLINKTFNLRVTLHPEVRKDKIYYHLNINSDSRNKGKGKHMIRPLSEIKKVQSLNYTGWLFDIETESSTFSAGIGLTWIHNSPRRGPTFVTKKITRAVARVKAGLEKKIYLGNLDAKRDWGYAPEYVEVMWKMLQQPSADDFVVATGEAHSIKEFLELAFQYGGLGGWKPYVEIDPYYFRPAEVEVLVGNSRKAKEKLNWEPKIKLPDLVKIMIDSDFREAGLEVPGEGDKILKERFPNRWWTRD